MRPAFSDSLIDNEGINQPPVAFLPRNRVTKRGTEFQVRLARADDLESVTELINETCAEGEFFHTDSFVLTPQWKLLFENCGVNEDRHSILLVAEMNEQVLGYARIFPPWFGKKGKHNAEMGISVKKPWREIGVGAYLLSDLIHCASVLGFLCARAEVISNNQRALNLFKKFGFREEARRRDYLCINNSFYDEVLMFLRIRVSISADSSQAPL